MRNHVFRALTRVPGVDAGLLKMTWIPDARYEEGFLAAGSHPAVGWQIPQPWVTDDAGATVRLDDVLDGQWAILYTGAPPAGTHAWTQLGVPVIPISEPTLIRWLRRKKADAVVVRPDGFIYAASQSGRPLPAPPAITPQNWSIPMTTVNLTEHTVTVNGKPIFVAETGSGPAVVMLHGGGPGASGVSNYSRNIDALAQHFRVIVPDMPGYGRSVKGVDQADPFGYLADTIRGLLDELGVDIAHLIGNSSGGAAALRLALDTPHRVGRLVLMGPGGIGTTRGVPTAGLKSLLSYGGVGPSREKLETFIRTYLVYDGASVPDELIDLRYRPPSIRTWWPTRRCAGRRSTLRTLWRMDLTRDSRLKTLQTPALVLGSDDKVN
jgi:2-hydroxy-6-oxonona-2,4-dienedioate hydrolase/4,5:9,10-diseco-3-hydroxy-5,9,17-trioxoandrosta-1(10),2-diene-4-oate hydrolase